MTRFISSWAIATLAEKKAVKPPKNKIMINTEGTNSNKGEQRIIKNTPAVTKVAAWINALTGVGVH